MREYSGHIQQSRAHMAQSKTSHCDREESNHVTPTKQSQAASFKHVASDYRLDFITINNMPANMTMKSSPSPVKCETRTRSG